MTLFIFIIMANIELPEQSGVILTYVPSDETALILPPVTTENMLETKSLPEPVVPIQIPTDEIIEPETLELPEYDQISVLMVPPLPNQIEIKVNYELLKGIEQLPVMIGGEEAFGSSIEYPEYARRAGIEGIVEVEFMVTEQGLVKDPVIVKGIGGGCDKAVLKAIKLQRYKAGVKGGEITSFKIKETVQFILINNYRIVTH
ncbi:energy transducer TonB [Gracilimonas sp.]|uniref:energy transducer TonB n=1 Tax=Gracilimonas sp. TaxID=1974203 RepID=UPI00374FF937